MNDWRYRVAIKWSEHSEEVAEHAAGATVAALARKFVRDPKTVERVVGLTPCEDRTHLPYVFDLDRDRTEFDRAVDRGLCSLTPGYRRLVDMPFSEQPHKDGGAAVQF